MEHLKEKEHVNESDQYLDNISQNAKQKNVRIKTEIVSSQMSIEGPIVEYAESQGIDLIAKCGIRNSYLYNMSCNGSKIMNK